MGSVRLCWVNEFEYSDEKSQIYADEICQSDEMSTNQFNVH